MASAGALGVSRKETQWRSRPDVARFPEVGLRTRDAVLTWPDGAVSAPSERATTRRTLAYLPHAARPFKRAIHGGGRGGWAGAAVQRHVVGPPRGVLTCMYKHAIHMHAQAHISSPATISSHQGRTAPMSAATRATEDSPHHSDPNTVRVCLIGESLPSGPTSSSSASGIARPSPPL